MSHHRWTPLGRQSISPDAIFALNPSWPKRAGSSESGFIRWAACFTSPSDTDWNFFLFLSTRMLRFLCPMWARPGFSCPGGKLICMRTPHRSPTSLAIQLIVSKLRRVRSCQRLSNSPRRLSNVSQRSLTIQLSWLGPLFPGCP